MPEKALFLPLKSTYFAAFAAGEKQVEYRKAGGRWNANTCAVGRPVVLSNGYGKGQRLEGTISAYEERLPAELGPEYEDWAVACDMAAGQKIACIHIHNIKPMVD